MGGAVAALAAQRFFNFKTAIPCHYGSFPIIDQTADKFIAGLDGTKTKVEAPKPGGSVESEATVAPDRIYLSLIRSHTAANSSG